MTACDQSEDLSHLDPLETRRRKRAWNKGPITDLFPRIDDKSLVRIITLHYVLEKVLIVFQGAHSRCCDRQGLCI